MNRIVSSLSLIVGLLVTLTALAAEPLVLDLWPGKTPGDVGITGEEYSRIHQSKILGGPTKLITNVTKPTLTIYQPPKEMNNGTAMLICPGGGYHDLYWELEGEEVAAWLISVGMTGIILKYRCPRRPGDVRGEPPLGPLLDLAVATATRFEKRTYEPIDAVDEVSCRPDFAIGCYSGYLKAKDKDEIPPSIHIPADTPPIFLAHCSDDTTKIGGSNPDNSAVMYLALEHADIPAELHIFATGSHDFGVRQNDKLPSSWMQLCLKWLRSRGLLKPSSIE